MVHNGERQPLLLFVAPYFPPVCYGGVVQVYLELLRRMSGYRIVVVGDQHGCSEIVRQEWDAAAPGKFGFEMRRIQAFELHLQKPDSRETGKVALVTRSFRQIKGAAAFIFHGRRAWRALLRELQPDVVICGGTYSAGWLMQLIPPSVPLVNYLHGEELTMKITPPLLMSWMRRRQMQSLRRASRNIAVSVYTARLAEILGGAASQRIELLPNFVDVSRFRLSGKREELREELGWSDRLVLLTLARLEPRKGIDQALRALARLHGEGRMPSNWMYIIAGCGVERAFLEGLASELGITSHTHFYGFVPDGQVPILYEAADLFLQPNREINGDTEGFGIVFLEANACGLPVIGGIAGGTADAIEDGVSGLRVDGDSVQAIADAVHSLVWNSSLRKQLGIQGAARVHRSFTVERAVAQFSRILAECCVSTSKMPSPDASGLVR
jgi:phosphatidylinositol alpha-1,6-mannosyltransferase